RPVVAPGVARRAQGEADDPDVVVALPRVVLRGLVVRLPERVRVGRCRRGSERQCEGGEDRRQNGRLPCPIAPATRHHASRGITPAPTVLHLALTRRGGGGFA